MAVLHVICVTNESSVLTDAEVQLAMPALQYQANYHFRPFWDAGCKFLWVPKGDAVPAGAWQLLILDDSDQAGALGYHDVNAAGCPILKIFAKTDKDAGLSWTITTSHELLEALADPDIVRGMQVTDTEWYALEVGDPVEADELGYAVRLANGERVMVSDFVLPAWFNPGATAIKYDYMRHCNKPLEVLAGGYQSIYVSGKGWTQVTNFRGEMRDVSHLVDKVPGQLRPRPSQEIRRLIREGKLA
jgi:hypothetical protein